MRHGMLVLVQVSATRKRLGMVCEFDDDGVGILFRHSQVGLEWFDHHEVEAYHDKREAIDVTTCTQYLDCSYRYLMDKVRCGWMKTQGQGVQRLIPAAEVVEMAFRMILFGRLYGRSSGRYAPPPQPRWRPRSLNGATGRKIRKTPAVGRIIFPR